MILNRQRRVYKIKFHAIAFYLPLTTDASQQFAGQNVDLLFNSTLHFVSRSCNLLSLFHTPTGSPTWDVKQSTISWISIVCSTSARCCASSSVKQSKVSRQAPLHFATAIVDAALNELPQWPAWPKLSSNQLKWLAEGNSLRLWVQVIAFYVLK